MQIKPVLLVSLLLLTFNLSAQEWNIAPKAGYGSYSMQDLKTIQNLTATSTNIGIKSVEQFPPYYFYGLDLTRHTRYNFSYGITGGYYSTGARNHYADYSGSIKEDYFVNAINLGFVFAWKKSWGSIVDLSMGFHSGLKLSGLNYKNELKLWDQSTSEKHLFKNQSFWFEPDFELSKKITSFFSLMAYIGYEVNTSGKTIRDGSPEDVLKVNEKSATIDWSGFRAGAGCIIHIR